MEPINILVIDDEVESVKTLLDFLKKNDINNEIGVYKIDKDILDCANIETYDVHKYGIDFQVVLIDYQLNRSFTGILVAAWMMLQLHVPRITLTSAAYPGPKSYFDAFIRKDEISDNPREIIERIVKCVQNFEYEKWLSEQYKELVNAYSLLIKDDENGKLLPVEKYNLQQLSIILDKFEKLIDSEQEKQLKEKEIYIAETDSFRLKEQQYTDKINTLVKKLEKEYSKLGIKDE